MPLQKQLEKKLKPNEQQAESKEISSTKVTIPDIQDLIDKVEGMKREPEKEVRGLCPECHKPECPVSKGLAAAYKAMK